MEANKRCSIVKLSAHFGAHNSLGAMKGYMRRLYSVSLCISIFALLLQTSAVQALERGVKLEERKEKMEERQENRQERKEERQEKRAEKAEDRAVRVEKRFAEHQAKLQKMIDRLATHIVQKKEAGKDVATAESALSTAKTSLATAVKLGEEAVAKLQAITPEKWSEQKTDVAAAREAVTTAQKAFAQVLKDLQKVIVALKAKEQL